MPREIVDKKINEMMEELKIDPNGISEMNNGKLVDKVFSIGQRIY